MSKEMEVYNYVRENSSEYLSTIIHALVDGVNAKNECLTKQKATIEGGLVTLMHYRKSSMPKSWRLTLLDALEACTHFRMDDFIKEIESEREVRREP